MKTLVPALLLVTAVFVLWPAPASAATLDCHGNASAGSASVDCFTDAAGTHELMCAFDTSGGAYVGCSLYPTIGICTSPPRPCYPPWHY